jgi:hypothetical protein
MSIILSDFFSALFTENSIKKKSYKDTSFIIQYKLNSRRGRKKNCSLLLIVTLGTGRTIMDIEMTTKTPQMSDWSLEEGNIHERQNSFNTNKKNNVTSNNTLIDVNIDEFRRYETTK